MARKYCSVVPLPALIQHPAVEAAIASHPRKEAVRTQGSMRRFGLSSKGRRGHGLEWNMPTPLPLRLSAMKTSVSQR